jgi:triphosphoribosyl-dephospho-CoA synthetase
MTTLSASGGFVPPSAIMSADDKRVLSELYEAAERWGVVLKAIKVLVLAAFALGLWVATLEIRQRVAADQCASAKEELDGLKTWKATTTANRWTIQEQQEFAASQARHEADLVSGLQQQNHLAGLRLQRLEDTQIHILSILEKIDQKIDQKLNQ